MAKEAVQRYDFPSYFGSHSSMIAEEATAKLNKPHLVILKDEHGYYRTPRNRLDTGLADPKRYSEQRLVTLLGGNKSNEAEELEALLVADEDAVEIEARVEMEAVQN